MSLNKPKQLLAMDALDQENRSKVTGTVLPILVSTLAAMSVAFWLNVGNHTASVSRGLAPWEEFYSVFGMIYAIVSGFLLVEVLNRFNKLSEVVEAELNAISDVRDFLLYVDGQEDIKRSVKKELQEY